VEKTAKRESRRLKYEKKYQIYLQNQNNKQQYRGVYRADFSVVFCCSGFCFDARFFQYIFAFDFLPAALYNPLNTSWFFRYYRHYCNHEHMQKRIKEKIKSDFERYNKTVIYRAYLFFAYHYFHIFLL
jgi:hypothetical protein